MLTNHVFTIYEIILLFLSTSDLTLNVEFEEIVSALVEPVLFIKALQIEKNYSPTHCCIVLRLSQKESCAHPSKFYGDTKASLIPEMEPFLNIFPTCLPQPKHYMAFSDRNFILID